jgi:hypothetical protein
LCVCESRKDVVTRRLGRNGVRREDAQDKLIDDETPYMPMQAHSGT